MKIISLSAACRHRLAGWPQPEGGTAHPHPAHGIGRDFPGRHVKDPVRVKPGERGNIGQCIRRQIPRRVGMDRVDHPEKRSHIWTREPARLSSRPSSIRGRRGRSCRVRAIRQGTAPALNFLDLRDAASKLRAAGECCG